MFCRCFAAVATVAAVAAVAAADVTINSYMRYGSLKDSTVMPTSAGIVLMGGGTDVDEAFQWMCNKTVGGDFLIIRATGTDAYNPYVRTLCPGLHSIATLIIASRDEANDVGYSSIVLAAEAVFIAGGDQSNYVNWWNGTALHAALQSRLTPNLATGFTGIPVGGTSAGLNILSGIVYTALGSDGVTSEEALANPFDPLITLALDFVSLPVISGVISDPHFSARDRMGRDFAFLCRIAALGWDVPPRCISVDEETALLIDPVTHQSTVVGTQGTSFVYFLHAPASPVTAPTVCQPNTPLTYTDVGVFKLGTGGTFDLSNWPAAGDAPYTVSALKGVLPYPAGAPVY